jgi:hypothetical protein
VGRSVTTADDVFTEESASPVMRAVALAHLSIELGHLYMDDFREGERRLREQFRRVRPWARTAVEQVTAELGGRTPRISTCFLIDDYFTRFSTPPEVVGALVEAATAEGLTIDYVARESGCARAGEIDVARLVQDHLVEEPPEGANGNRPPTARTGWLTNGVRSPAPNGAAMGRRQQAGWQPPRQSAVQNHSIFVDIELWSTGGDADERRWSCPFLAAVWQLQRLGLLRHLGRPIAEPQPVAAADLPAHWDRMPPVVRLNPAAAPMRAYRTFSAIDSRFLHIEMAVRTILGSVGVDPFVDGHVRTRARGEGIDLPAEIVGRIAYAFL